MNLNLIQSKLNEINTPKGGSQKANEKALSFWKPTIGKALVRFVPSNQNPENPFMELYFHYGIGKRTIISPTNFGEKDPILEFSKELRKTKEPENWKLAKKLEPKMRVFAPVIIRGEEEKGVRLWEFGKEIYQALLSLAADEDVGDFTDIMEGRDMKVETVGPETTGTAYNKSTVLPAMKTTQLSTNNTEVEKWLATQPDPTSFSKKYTFDEIKQFLVEFLNPEEEAPKTESAGDEFLALPKTQSVPKTESTPKGPFTPTSAPIANKAFALKPKENIAADEFDDLFK
tara:strand:+ start:1457 stop:2317 length:861 start_codon:yes stop_codon:yes gene_type:complete